MGKYIKLFETHAEYQTYINGSDKILPNVSYCEDNNDVHYNPYYKPLIATFNIESTSSATEIIYNDSTSYFTEIEIDGVVQPSVVSSYTFDTTGEHTIKYTLVDPTQISNAAFNGCTSLTNITIPNSVTTIGNKAFYGCTGLTNVTISDSVTTIGGGAFYGCTGLTNVTISDSVTTIGGGAFNGCTGLTSITIQATTPPTLDYFVFGNTNNNCPIYVPSASVAAYKAASGWSDYASRIQAIPTT